MQHAFLLLFSFALFSFSNITLARPISGTHGLAAAQSLSTLAELSSDRANDIMPTASPRYIAVRDKEDLLHPKKHYRYARKFTRKNAHFAMEQRYQKLMQEFEWQQNAMHQLIEESINSLI